MATGIYLRGKRGKYKKEDLKVQVICGSCGTNFVAQRKNRKYCSGKCTQRYWASLKPKYQKKGKIVGCAYCKAKIYKHPSELGYAKSYCSQEHYRLDSFNFPCLTCGKVVYTQPYQFNNKRRSTCSPECRRKLARKRALDRHMGYTKHQLNRIARYSPEAVAWRKSVFERDNYTCQVCNVRGTYLEADHIKPWAYFPELRFELSNGRTLCRPCHDKTKIGYQAMRKLYAPE